MLGCFTLLPQGRGHLPAPSTCPPPWADSAPSSIASLAPPPLIFLAFCAPHVPIYQGGIFTLFIFVFFLLSLPPLFFFLTKYIDRESDYHSHLCCRQIRKLGVSFSNFTRPLALREHWSLVRAVHLGTCAPFWALEPFRRNFFMASSESGRKI